MNEIKEAIEKIKAIKADDQETIQALADAENLLSQADGKHDKLLGDYRQILVSHPSTQKFKEEDDNPPPPAPPKEITFDDALSQILAKRKEKQK